jgi:hypothetical protein
MTVQHPTTPGAQYASMEVCQQLNADSPGFCQEVLHRDATAQAVTTGAAVVGVLAYTAYIIWLIVTLGR